MRAANLWELHSVGADPDSALLPRTVPSSCCVLEDIPADFSKGSGRATVVGKVTCRSVAYLTHSVNLTSLSLSPYHSCWIHIRKYHKPMVAIGVKKKSQRSVLTPSKDCSSFVFSVGESMAPGMATFTKGSLLCVIVPISRSMFMISPAGKGSSQ